jgi:glycosyltransferase involved in cell wall biosynthesis
MHERRKVLVIAESANPELSSSSLVGWSLSKALRDDVDAHVVTHVRNREGLERAGWREGREYTAIDPGPVEHPINRFGDAVRKIVSLGWTWTTVLATVSYYYFEHQLWRRFGASIRLGEFDLVHRITPVSPATPSLLAGHCRDAGVPFVWGPMNGGVPWPKEFRGALRREGEWLSYVRGLHRLLPGYELTRSAAAAVITGSSFAWREMERHHDRCVYIPENAIEPSRFQVANSSPQSGPLRAAFAGRLVPLKGVDMLVDAAAPLVKAGRLAVDIIGDGPEMPALRRRVAEAGVVDGIRLHGWLDHLDVVRRLAGSHVFAFPSFREFGGGAVLEAMTLGLVPVVINHGGPGELVTEETGFRVPLGPRESVVDSFREILSGLVADPERARRMGARARQRVEKLFTWDVKARQIVEVYRWVLGERGKPDFGMPLREDAA